MNVNKKPQIKICGLTDVQQALQCAEMGADAIGCVFFHRSPRNLTEDQAKAICSALPSHIATIGVFVDEPFSFIMEKAKYCGLKGVQLHGQESSELVNRLKAEGLIVIKGLFVSRKPGLDQAAEYNPTAFLVECGKGILPGGNAKTWNWAEARELGEKYPLILAGGLSADNIVQAVADSQPDAVDLSSALESSPGHKDMEKVRIFMQNISRCSISRETRRIFT